MEVLYRDTDIAVIIKPVGLISEDGNADDSVCPLIRDALSRTSVYPVHRLDRNVGGVMVYALNQSAAAVLSVAVRENRFAKTYLALVHGAPTDAEGTFEDLLFKDSRRNKTFVVERKRVGVKEASLSYTVLAERGGVSLVRVLLHTGRSHQIRVQFASRKMPLLGDGKYGAADNLDSLGLFSHRIEFEHPVMGEKLCFSALPVGKIWEPFCDETGKLCK